MLRRSFACVPAVLVLSLACGERYDADAPSLPEAGLDVQAPPIDAAPDGGPSTFCSTKGDAAVWCEYFDSITGVTTLNLEASEEIAKGQLTVEKFFSPPRSLRLNFPANKPLPYASTMKHSFVTDRDVVRLELDWNANVFLPLEGQLVQGFTVMKGSGSAALERECLTADGGPACRWFVGTCIRVEAGAAPVCRSFDVPAPAALNGWSHIALEVRFAPNGHVKFEEDTVTLVDASAETMGMPSTDPAAVSIGFGMLAGSTSYYEVFIDNAFILLP